MPKAPIITNRISRYLEKGVVLNTPPTGDKPALAPAQPTQTTAPKHPSQVPQAPKKQ